MRGDLPTAPSTGTGVLSPAPNVRAEAMPVRQVYLSRSRSPAAKPSAPPLAAAKRIFIRGDGGAKRSVFSSGAMGCAKRSVFSSGAMGCAKRSVFSSGATGCAKRSVFSSGALGCGGNPRPVGSIAGTPVKFIRRTVLFRRVEVQQRHLITSVKGVNHGLVSRNHRSQAKRGFFNAE